MRDTDPLFDLILLPLVLAGVVGLVLWKFWPAEDLGATGTGDTGSRSPSEGAGGFTGGNNRPPSAPPSWFRDLWSKDQDTLASAQAALRASYPGDAGRDLFVADYLSMFPPDLSWFERWSYRSEAKRLWKKAWEGYDE